MKRPSHMTMRELVALPVIGDVEALLDCEVDNPRNHGGAFQDESGHLWRTLRTDMGWSRYPAHLAVLADARRQAHVVPVAYAAARNAGQSRPASGVLGAVLRAFG